MLVKQLISPSGSTIDGPLLLTPQAFGDERGWFIESWNQRHFDEAVGEAVVFFPGEPLSLKPGGASGAALPVGTDNTSQIGASQ